MKALNVRNRSKARYHRVRSSFQLSAPCRGAPHTSRATTLTTRPKSICARLRRVFTFRWRSTPKQQPTFREDVKYHHVPVHAASTFLNSTTTGAMADVEALQRLEAVDAFSERDGGEKDGEIELGGLEGREAEILFDEKRLVDVVETWRQGTERHTGVCA